MINMLEGRIPIFVIGYPKSGNTWVTRLVGDALKSPTGSGYGKHELELATEGKGRPCSYFVLKSHHSQRDKPEYITNKSKVIYIYRDFRDVLVSSFFHHYRIDEKLVLKEEFTHCRSFSRTIWRKIIFNIEMLNLTRAWGSISGGMSFAPVCIGFIKGRWLRNRDFIGGKVGSWSNHIQYWTKFSSNVFTISYEQLLENPYFRFRRAFEYLNIDYDEQRLMSAIDRQYFKNKKKQFAKNNDTANLLFMLIGFAGDCKRFLSHLKIDFIIKKNVKIMNKKIYIEDRNA